ncbi:MAG: TRAP transporter substrate-binding protein [Alkalispirochaetaceae bacterium]
MKRLLIVLLVLVVAASFGWASGAQEESSSEEEVYVFKYSNSQSENHPRSKSMVQFKEELEAASDGRIEVELYFGGVLGKEAEVLDQVKLGTIQGCRGGLFERANPKYLLYTLPFMFEDPDQVTFLMRSEFGQEINAGAMENGFYIPATGVAGGMRNVTNSVRPIETAEDIEGLKMRTPPIDVTIRTFEALGANPQQVAYTDTYMALKTGVVDGQENPFSNIVDMKFYEAQEYLSLLNWQVHPDPFYVNPGWYDSLPADLKEVFDEVAAETIEYSDEIWLASEFSFLEELEKHLEVNEITAANRESFVERVQSVWQYYVDEGYFTQADIDRALAIVNQS